MNRSHRHIVRIAALLAAASVLVPAAQAGSNSGDVGLARGTLETQAGFSPSRAVDWTTGVCSYADKPSSCYLTPGQARSQSYALAAAMGAPATPSHASSGRQGSFVGDVGFARAILESLGLSPSRAAEWTNGVCSYGDNPSSCYLTADQAAAQSHALALAMGVPTIPSSLPPVQVARSSGGFAWADAGIGAAVTLGLVLLLAGIGAIVVRGRRRQPIHA